MMDQLRKAGQFGLVLLIFGVCLYGAAPGSGVRCYKRSCGDTAFNPTESTCCEVSHDSSIQACVNDDLSQEVSDCCKLKAFNPLNEICCQSTVVVRTAVKAQCCGESAIDEERQLCCGPEKSKVILFKQSKDHRCCGQAQYNPKTECCCPNKSRLQIKNQTSSDCKACESSLTSNQPSKTMKCNSGSFDPVKQLCCGPSGNKVLLLQESRDHRCCGRDQYNIKTQRCTDNLTVTEATQVCRPCPPDQKCCGNKVYNPSSQICCHGHSYTKQETFECCGHLYYNNSLWACCFGRLIPKSENQTQKVTRLLSITNLTKRQSCEKINVGTVDSVSNRSIVFCNVLVISGKRRLVYPSPNPNVEITNGSGNCSFQGLEPGETYYFDATHFYNSDFKSVNEAFYFIVAKCST